MTLLNQMAAHFSQTCGLSHAAKTMIMLTGLAMMSLRVMLGSLLALPREVNFYGLLPFCSLELLSQEWPSFGQPTDYIRRLLKWPEINYNY